MGYNIGEAVKFMREGSRARRGRWGPADPSYLVLIPGREVSASYKPMTDHLGEGTKFHVRGHVDAIYEASDPPMCKVGYEFTQEDVLTADWYLV